MSAGVELFWDEEDELQVHFRLYVDTDVYEFICELCCLAKRVGREIYSPELEETIQPCPHLVVRMLLRSEAWSETWDSLVSFGMVADAARAPRRNEQGAENHRQPVPQDMQRAYTHRREETARL